MSFMDRLSNGWKIAMNSFKILGENKKLIIFPMLSGISLLLVIASFFVAIFAASGWNFDNLNDNNPAVNYLVLFVFYVFNYFIIVFFNMALVHCTHLYFKGEEVTLRKGLEFSLSRIGVIFSWAVFAATVGTILRAIQENSGAIGKIITGLIGIVWSVTTFFVVPVIAYEKLGPIDAFKRSAQLMKQKWGESLGATFSFGLMQFLAMIILGGVLFFLGAMIHPLVGVLFAIPGIFIVLSIFSAAHTIFVSAVYHDVTGDPTEHFNKQLIDGLFVNKK
ncbi:MAG: DUF6159 family protein [Chitinophagaceae bacterium]